MACHSENKTIIKQDQANFAQHKQVALVGNPNVGKSQIFNILTNSHEMVGNFPGITVSMAQGIFKTQNTEAIIIDLPGSYSLSNKHNVENITRNWILEHTPDIIVNVVDASNLQRNLLLTLILMEFDIPIILVLNMMDIAKGKGLFIDSTALAKELGIPVFSLTSVNKQDQKNLFLWFEKQVENPPDDIVYPKYSQKMNQSITKIKNLISPLTSMSFWHACKILEGSDDFYNCLKEKQVIQVSPSMEMVDKSFNITVIEQELEMVRKQEPDTQALFYKERHTIITEILSKVQKQVSKDRSLTQHLDIVLTNKYLGLPIFILIVWVMFKFTFDTSLPFVDYISIGMDVLASGVSLVGSFIPHSELLVSFINDGLISGAGTVLSFLPIVFFLFIVISILEESGYFSRGSFIVDKIMVQFGLEGRSFVPMVLGFGCNIPAVMSTRNIEGKKERMLTISILPFMSCSARLPIYILFGTIFFLYNTTELILFLYLFGVVIGLLVILLFKFILKKRNYFSTPLILEMPPYILPNWNSVLSRSTNQVKSFVKKITTIVLLGSAIIWVLSHIVITPLSIQANPNYQQTVIGILGMYIQPIFAPLGFNWKLVVALIFGFMAKEVIISTLGILYLGSGVMTSHLTQVLSSDPTLTPLVAFTFLVFVLLYIPCIATVGIIKSETNKKYALFVVGYTLVVAYTVSWLVYTLGSILL